MGCDGVYCRRKRGAIDMAMKKERTRFVPVMLPLILGLIVGLTLGRGQRPRSPAVRDITQASLATGVGRGETHEVRRPRLSLARAARRGFKLVPRGDRGARGGVWGGG